MSFKLTAVNLDLLNVYTYFCIKCIDLYSLNIDFYQKNRNYGIYFKEK
jgi:hypothetical protein